jgi:fatty acid desaturase
MMTPESRSLSRSLTPEQRQYFTSQTNLQGSLRALLHFGLIAMCMALIALAIPCWPLLLLPLGVLMVFLFTLLHETIHRTAFKRRIVNDVIAHVCGLILFLPPKWFRYFHFAHHRHTQDPERDPELITPAPRTIGEYVRHISGVPLAFSLLKTLWLNATGDTTDVFVAERSRVAVMWESRMMLLSYLLVTLVSISTGSLEVLVIYWWLPLLLGQPFLRLYLMAEHGRCPFTANMFANTRTVFTNRLVCLFAWNMPFHAEHHAYPAVPFHKLPALHQLVKDQLQVTANGYTEFHRETIGSYQQK